MWIILHSGLAALSIKKRSDEMKPYPDFFCCSHPKIVAIFLTLKESRPIWMTFANARNVASAAFSRSSHPVRFMTPIGDRDVSESGGPAPNGKNILCCWENPI